MSSSSLAFLESYALSSRIDRAAILNSPNPTHQLTHDQRTNKLVQQKYLQYWETHGTPSNESSSTSPLDVLTSDGVYKSLVKEWRELESRSGAYKEQLMRHQLVRWNHATPNEQAEFIEALVRELPLYFNHTKPYVRPEPEPESAAGPGEEKSHDQSASKSSKPTHPNTLSLDLSNLSSLLHRHFSHHGGVDAFELENSRALDWLGTSGVLEQEEYEQWLCKLTRADVSGVTEAFIEALKYKYSPMSFARPSISRLLSLEQLQAIGRGHSDLRKYDSTYLACLFRKSCLPPLPLSYLSLSERQSFYTRLWKFAKDDLGDGGDDHRNTFITLKARMYFACLRFELDEMDTYNWNHFYKLLSLPLQSSSRGYGHGVPIRHAGSGSRVAQITSEGGGFTRYRSAHQPWRDIIDENGYVTGTDVATILTTEPLLPPVTLIEEQQFFERFITKYYESKDVKKWDDGKMEKYFERYYLEDLFARAKLTTRTDPWNLSDPSSKESKLYHSYLSQLLHAGSEWLTSTRFEFASSTLARNASWYPLPDSPVQLGLILKNVGHVTLKVFALKTREFYSNPSSDDPSSTEADPASITVDGLVPNEVATFDYTSLDSYRTVSRDLPLRLDCDGWSGGVFLVEVTSSTAGKKMRCIIKKGRLTQVSATNTKNGQALKIINSEGKEIHVRTTRVFTGVRRCVVARIETSFVRLTRSFFVHSFIRCFFHTVRAPFFFTATFTSRIL